MPPGPMMMSPGPMTPGGDVVLEGDRAGDSSIVEESSQTETGVGTHPPFGIAVIEISHERLGLDFSVDFYGDRGGGKGGGKISAHKTTNGYLGEISGGIADADFLVPPFNLGREALFEGVAKGRCQTGSSFNTVPQLALRVVWENG